MARLHYELPEDRVALHAPLTRGALRLLVVCPSYLLNFGFWTFGLFDPSKVMCIRSFFNAYWANLFNAVGGRVDHVGPTPMHDFHLPSSTVGPIGAAKVEWDGGCTLISPCPLWLGFQLNTFSSRRRPPPLFLAIKLGVGANRHWYT